MLKDVPSAAAVTMMTDGFAKAGVAVLAGVALTVLPTAAGAGTPTPVSRPKITFTVGMNEDVDSLNPFVGVQTNAFEINGVIYDALIDYSAKDGTPTGRLARSWESSPDGLTWTYHLRKGVTWSDGQPLTAGDAAYTFNRIIHGDAEKVNWGNFTAVMKEATAVDPQTLVIKVSKPSSIMNRLVVPILPEHVWKNISEKQVSSFKNEVNTVGSGPFILTRRSVGQDVELRANTHYWGGAPKIDNLIFRVFDNTDIEAQALKNGEIDFANKLPNVLFDSIKKVPGITTVAGDAGRFDEVAFNTGAATVDGKPIGDGNPALKDPVVRRALSRAIDRQALTQRVIGGHGKAADSVIPSTWVRYHYVPTDDAQRFDLARANADLDAAGYKKGPDGIRRTPDGRTKLRFRFFARQESYESQQVGQYVQGWFKQLGIQVNVRTMAEAKLIEVIGNGEFDMFEWGWNVEPDPDYQLSAFTCDQRSTGKPGDYTGGLDDSFYCDKAYDALYKRQKVELDPVKREKIVKRMQKLLYDDVPYAVIYYQDELQAYRSDRFTGMVSMPQPGGPLLFQPAGYWSYRTLGPVSAGAATKSGGPNAGLFAGVGAAVLVVVGGSLLSRRRRARTLDERE